MKTDKKGLTAEELVILIASAAILTAVLISAAGAGRAAVRKEAEARFEELCALDLADGTPDGKSGGRELLAEADFAGCTYDAAAGIFTYTDAGRGYTAVFDMTAGKWTVEEAAAEENGK